MTRHADVNGNQVGKPQQAPTVALNGLDAAFALRRASIICRGARRLLRAKDYASLTEVSLGNGRRADILAIGPRGDVIIVEIKSSIADFRADHKWPEYRDYCDRFYFAVGADFPQLVLPSSAGLILADGYGGEIMREPEAHPLAGPRRKSLTLSFARGAARRLHDGHDPAQSL